MAEAPVVYPPPDQILSALGIEIAWRDAETLVGRATADVALLGTDGGPPGMGALSPVIDLVAGARASATAEGDWLVTSDMWLHERAPIDTGPLLIETRLLRSGKRSTVVAVEALNGDRPAVSGTVEFSRIRRDASPHVTSTAAPDQQWVRLGSGALLDRPLSDACDLRILDLPDGSPGVAEVHRSPFVANSIGTLQGGVVVLVADAAASATLGPAARTVDMQFRFLAQTGDGPARATAEVIRRDGPEVTVKVEVVDQGDGALVGWAVCRVVSGQ